MHFQSANGGSNDDSWIRTLAKGLRTPKPPTTVFSPVTSKRQIDNFRMESHLSLLKKSLENSRLASWENVHVFMFSIQIRGRGGEACHHKSPRG